MAGLKVKVIGQFTVIRAAASARVVNYSNNFLLLEYSLISISGCKFPFPFAIFCSQLSISPPSVQQVTPAGQKTSKSASELLKYRRFAFLAMLPVTILTLTTSPPPPSSSLAACIKVLPVLTSTQVLVKVLGRVLE